MLGRVGLLFLDDAWKASVLAEVPGSWIACCGLQFGANCCQLGSNEVWQSR